MTPCGDYTYFCCGQDDTARSCCTSGNGTVLVAAGTAILPTVTATATVTDNSTCTATDLATACPLTNGTLSPEQNNTTVSKGSVPIGAVAGLGAALGVALLAVVVLTILWKKKANKAASAEQQVEELEKRVKDLEPLAPMRR